MLDSHVTFAGVNFDIETQSLRVCRVDKPIQIVNINSDQDFEKIRQKILDNVRDMAKYSCRTIFFKLTKSPEIALEVVEKTISNAIEICFARFRRLLQSLPVNLRICLLKKQSFSKGVVLSVRTVIHRKIMGFIDAKTQNADKNEVKVFKALRIECEKLIARKMFSKAHKLRRCGLLGFYYYNVTRLYAFFLVGLSECS